MAEHFSWAKSQSPTVGAHHAVEGDRLPVNFVGFAAGLVLVCAILAPGVRLGAHDIDTQLASNVILLILQFD